MGIIYFFINRNETMKHLKIERKQKTREKLYKHLASVIIVIFLDVVQPSLRFFKSENGRNSNPPQHVITVVIRALVKGKLSVAIDCESRLSSDAFESIHA